MVRKKILSRAKKNNFKRKAKGRRVQSKRVSKRVSKKRTKRTKRSSNKKIRKSFKKLRDRTRLSLRDMRGGAALEPESLELKLEERPKVNKTEYEKIMTDLKIEKARSGAAYWEMVYNKNNIFILIYIHEQTPLREGEIKIETMKARHDESIPRAPKGIATRVLYHMIRKARSIVHPGYTINVTATTDESNIESLCRYYENMSFKKDPLHPREEGPQRLKTSVSEFLNNRINDILIELIEIMISNGIQNAEKLINTLEWRDIMQDDENETIYNLLSVLREDFDEEDYLSEILSSDDKTKMKDIFNLYLSEV